MNILLVCAGGLSTSILMKKMKKWADDNDVALNVEAVAKSGYLQKAEAFDCILLGPQISYSLDEVSKNAPIPVASIEPLDYAMGDAEKIINLARKTINGG